MQEEKVKFENPTNEIMFVGALYQKPEEYLSYGSKITSENDFSDEVTRFFYDLFSLYYKTYSETVDQNKLNAFAYQDDKRIEKYKEFGGYSVIKKWMEISDSNDIENYYSILKKFSLLRKYVTDLNFERMLKHPKFAEWDAETLHNITRGKIDSIKTEVSAGKESSDLGHATRTNIKNLLFAPQMGIEYPWPELTEMFRGMRTGKLALNGFLSNEGKSRNLMMLMAYVTLIHGEKFLLMSNEMTEEDLRSCLITTVINNECFKELHGIDITKCEKEIVLGLYRDDKTNDFVVREEDENGEFLESEENYHQRVFRSSSEYRNVIKVGEWIETTGKGKILFQDVGSGYSDQELEFEIRKHQVVYGVRYFGYDTLKGYKTDNWEFVKQTATRLSELMKELDTFMWAVFQLTDDTVFTDFFDLSSNNIANAKQMKHVCDYMLLGKQIPPSDYGRYEYVCYNDDWTESTKMELDKSKRYFGMIVEKNRGGSKDYKPLFVYDLNLNLWRNVGSLLEKEKDFED